RVEPVERLGISNSEQEHRAAPERVVGGRAPARIEAEELAGEAPGILRELGLPPVAGADVEHPVGAEADPATVVELGGGDSIDDRAITGRGLAAFGEAPALDGILGVSWPREINIEIAVGGEIRVKRDPEQTALALADRDGRDRAEDLSGRREAADAARPL